MTTYSEEDLRAALAGDAERSAMPTDVWPRLQRGIIRRRRTRAGLTLAGAAAAVAALVVVLPIDGGSTRVPVASGATHTLVPGRPLSAAELRASAEVLRQRVDGLGISGATITTGDGVVDVTAPNLRPATLAAISAPGVLQFRPVLGIEPADPTADSVAGITATSSLATAEDVLNSSAACNNAGSEAARRTSTYVVTCSDDGTQRYLLGPVALDNADVASADALHDTVQGGWFVTLNFDPQGSEKFLALTKDAAEKPDMSTCLPPVGCDAIAIVVDGVVQSAPSVEQPGGIRGGATQIAGSFTAEEARALAAMAASPPLPVSFAPKAP